MLDKIIKILIISFFILTMLASFTTLAYFMTDMDLIKYTSVFMWVSDLMIFIVTGCLCGLSMILELDL